VFLNDDGRFRPSSFKARSIWFLLRGGPCRAPLVRWLGRPQIVVRHLSVKHKSFLAYGAPYAGGRCPDRPRIRPTSSSYMGTDIVAMSTNFRTAQAGRVIWLDEFANVVRQQRIADGSGDSRHHGNGRGRRGRVFSTPFLCPRRCLGIRDKPHRNKHEHWSRRTITIEDAISQGMPLPGASNELRIADSTAKAAAMFYECPMAENGSALLSWGIAALAHRRTHSCRTSLGRLRGRCRCRRRLHMIRTAIAIVGRS